MNINEAFPSNYIKASDLKGRDANVTIDRVEIEAVGRDKDSKPVLYFVGKEKGLVLNRTNANTIGGMYGSDTEQWAGKNITIYPTETEFGGERVECVRVRLKAPGAAAAASKPKPAPAAPSTGPLSDDDIPF